MFSNNKKKYAKEYYEELYNIYKLTIDLFEKDSEFKILLSKNNNLGFELLSLMLFYTSRKHQEIISDNKLALNLINFVHDLYYEDLKNKMRLTYEERKQASNLLNKRYSDYSDTLNADEPILALARYFIINVFNSNINELAIILSSSNILVMCVKSIESLTKNLTNKYHFT